MKCDEMTRQAQVSERAGMNWIAYPTRILLAVQESYDRNTAWSHVSCTGTNGASLFILQDNGMPPVREDRENNNYRHQIAVTKLLFMEKKEIKK